MAHDAGLSADSLIPQHSTAAHVQPGGFFASQTSPQRPGQGRNADNRAIMPVTFKQLLESEKPGEDVFYLNGMPIQMITFVALVRSITPHGAGDADSGTEYLMDDTTGLMPVVVWSTGNPNPFQINTYGRVFGQFRKWKGRLQVQATYAVPVVDMNELSCHMLEVISMFNFATKGALPLPPPKQGGQQSQTQARSSTATQQQQQQQQQATAGNPYANMDPLEQEIFGLVQHRSQTDGDIKREEVVSQLSGRFQSDIVLRKVEELVQKQFFVMGRSADTVTTAF